MQKILSKNFEIVEKAVEQSDKKDLQLKKNEMRSRLDDEGYDRNAKHYQN